MVGTHCLLCDQPPRVATAFRCRLQHNVIIPRRSLQELQPFSTPSNTEQFHQRGQAFNTSSGRYTAPVSGFYQLTASLLLDSNESPKRPQARQRDSVKASICIESLCQSNVSLETVTGVSATGGLFSILLTGTLYLQAGEYVSILIDNGTGSALTILKDSLFSGILIGVWSDAATNKYQRHCTPQNTRLCLWKEFRTQQNHCIGTLLKHLNETLSRFSNYP